MIVFVGLGNPGAKYAHNRHNIGFMALDAIADRHGFSPWRNKFQGELCEGQLGTQKVLLLKPQTFMNRSGQSVGELLRFYKLAPSQVTVFHDELDLAPGKIKVKTGGGHAGHNGLRSIHDHIGADYHRLRLGIGHPGDKSRVAGYVLNDFAKSDDTWLGTLLDNIARSAELLAKGDGAKFLNDVAMSSHGVKPKSKAKLAQKKAAKSEPDAPMDNRSALQKLVDRFSKS